MGSAAPAAAGANRDTVRVELGTRSYDILIGPGLLRETGRQLARVAPGSRAIIVTDRNVARYHLEPLQEALNQAGIGAHSVTVEPGESSKSFPVLAEVVDAILGARLERRDIVLALGGGVVGDLAGFAAGIARRGMPFIQVPTSLLAQVDSSVGGKTGIDTGRGKNLVGVFHQPLLVLADTDVLDTLPSRQFRAGYAEIAKYGLINDADFFLWLEKKWVDVFAGGPSRQQAIRVSCAAKAAIVARDETESGDRALLNLGHTFGHALEAATGYSDRLVHGEAIAIGMVLAAGLSARLQLCGPEVETRIRDHFVVVGLPVSMMQVPGGAPSVAGMMELIAQDKKVERGKLNFILLRGIGQAFIAKDIPGDEVVSFLEERIARS